MMNTLLPGSEYRHTVFGGKLYVSLAKGSGVFDKVRA